MKMQTPKNYDKKSSMNYTTPIGLLKNYNSVNLSNNANNYEEQFYKIKAQRLQTELEQLKQQIAMLKTKNVDISALNQHLKERIFVLQNNLDRNQRSYTHRSIPSFVSDSGYPSANNSVRQSPSKQSKYHSISIHNDKTQRSAYNSEIQRLAKQNRILKNQHEIQMSKLKDQNKKLTRKILQLELNTSKKPSDSQIQSNEKNLKQKQEQRLLKVQRTNNQLRKQNQQVEKQRKRLEQRLKSLQQNNKSLKKQNQQLVTIYSSKSKTHACIEELRNQLQNKQKQYQQHLNILQKEIKQLKTSGNKKVDKNIKQVNNESDESGDTSSKITKYQNQLQLLKRKMAIYEQTIQDKDQQIKGILTKLKPLIDKQKNNKSSIEDSIGDNRRASLSILQVFLKKYKINSF